MAGMAGSAPRGRSPAELICRLAWPGSRSGRARCARRIPGTCTGGSRTGALVRGPGLRQLTCDACSYLLASYLGQRWRDRLGDDLEHVRAITRLLDPTLRAIGRYAEACKLAQDTLDRDRRILGVDHPAR